MPAFSTYKGGEIDYVVQTIRGHRRYLVEVKSGKGRAATALKAWRLEGGLPAVSEGHTRAAWEGKFFTLPLYMLEQI